jgi:hypothetical protein
MRRNEKNMDLCPFRARYLRKRLHSVEGGVVFSSPDPSESERFIRTLTIRREAKPTFGIGEVLYEP